MDAYQQGLDRNAANCVPLTPLTFLNRSADVYPNRTSVVYGNRRYTWQQTRERCLRLSAALQQMGVRRNDTVAALLPNVPAMYEAHFGVPMAGAVLNTINTRLDAEAIAFILQHGEASVLLTDPEFAPVVQKALSLIPGRKPRVVDVLDAEAGFDQRIG